MGSASWNEDYLIFINCISLGALTAWTFLADLFILWLFIDKTINQLVTSNDNENNNWLQLQCNWGLWATCHVASMFFITLIFCLLLRFISTTAPCLRTRCPMWTAQERNIALNSCSISSRPTTMRWDSKLTPPPLSSHPSIYSLPPLLQGNTEVKGGKKGNRQEKWTVSS